MARRSTGLTVTTNQATTTVGPLVSTVAELRSAFPPEKESRQISAPPPVSESRRCRASEQRKARCQLVFVHVVGSQTRGKCLNRETKTEDQAVIE